MRKKLPDIRSSVTRKVPHVGEIEIYVIVGFYEPEILSSSGDVETTEDVEQPGEIFINVAKQGSTLGGLLDVIAIMMSMQLQFDVPWEKIARKMRNTNFEPCDANGKSIMHSIVIAVDELLKDRGSLPDKGHSL